MLKRSYGAPAGKPLVHLYDESIAELAKGAGKGRKPEPGKRIDPASPEGQAIARAALKAMRNKSKNVAE